MKKYLSLLFIGFMLWFTSCSITPVPSAVQNQYNIIPLPASLQTTDGQFLLSENTVLVADTAIQNIAVYFADKIKPATGYELSIVAEEKAINTIIFQLDESISAEEGYTLSINSKRILLKAKQPNGLFHGVQTLRQLLPKEVEQSQKVTNITWALPAVEIDDAPRFSYRGMHLDVSRHFFGVDEVKKFIDLLALHKMNRFHWHLTEDQGWRIEIKKYPKLTEIGGFRNGTLIGHYNDQPHQFDNKRYGGFYTQEEVKEVIAYAEAQYITIVPEIELPGHAQAALAAYPELGCTPGPFEVLQKWGVSDNVFCPKEETFDFLENVLTEVIDLFPGQYIHIGGDECPKTKWKESAFCQQLIKKEGLKDEHELQSYFIQRIEKFINSKGRSIIGWDEILEGGLAPNATVMSWRGIEGGIEAAKAGHDVIMTPTTNCYLDYYQSDHPDEPLAIGGFLPLKKVYQYEPIPAELNAEEAKHVLGTQGNIWTEYMKTFDKVTYMAFPRASAIAEIAWSPKEAKDFDNFVSRLPKHLSRLDYLGVKTANHLYDLATSIQPTGDAVAVNLSTLAKGVPIYYTTDGSEPSTKSSLYETPITITSNSTLRAQAFIDGQKAGRAWQQTFKMHKAAGKTISLTNDPHPKYQGDGNGSIINGLIGSSERYGDAEWLGFANGTDMEALIDLGESTNISTTNFRFFKGEGQQIYLPKSIQVSVSTNGEHYREVGKRGAVVGDQKVIEVEVPLVGAEGQFFKIKVENYGLIPEGRQGGGNKPWLFVDEIRIN